MEILKIFDVNHIGSRKSLTQILITKDFQIYIRCGCFFDSIEQFKKSVKETHNENIFSKEYLLLIEFAEGMLNIIKI